MLTGFYFGQFDCNFDKPVIIINLQAKFFLVVGFAVRYRNLICILRGKLLLQSKPIKPYYRIINNDQADT